jgi:hypothetical protein
MAVLSSVGRFPHFLSQRQSTPSARDASRIATRRSGDQSRRFRPRLRAALMVAEFSAEPSSLRCRRPHLLHYKWNRLNSGLMSERPPSRVAPIRGPPAWTALYSLDVRPQLFLQLVSGRYPGTVPERHMVPLPLSLLGRQITLRQVPTTCRPAGWERVWTHAHC